MDVRVSAAEIVLKLSVLTAALQAAILGCVRSQSVPFWHLRLKTFSFFSLKRQYLV